MYLNSFGLSLFTKKLALVFGYVLLGSFVTTGHVEKNHLLTKEPLFTKILEYNTLRPFTKTKDSSYNTDYTQEKEFKGHHTQVLKVDPLEGIPTKVSNKFLRILAKKIQMQLKKEQDAQIMKTKSLINVSQEKSLINTDSANPQVLTDLVTTKSTTMSPTFLLDWTDLKNWLQVLHVQFKNEQKSVINKGAELKAKDHLVQRLSLLKDREISFQYNSILQKTPYEFYKNILKCFDRDFTKKNVTDLKVLHSDVVGDQYVLPHLIFNDAVKSPVLENFILKDNLKDLTLENIPF